MLQSNWICWKKFGMRYALNIQTCHCISCAATAIMMNAARQRAIKEHSVAQYSQHTQAVLDGNVRQIYICADCCIGRCFPRSSGTECFGSCTFCLIDLGIWEYLMEAGCCFLCIICCSFQILICCICAASCGCVPGCIVSLHHEMYRSPLSAIVNHDYDHSTQSCCH